MADKQVAEEDYNAAIETLVAAYGSDAEARAGAEGRGMSALDLRSECGHVAAAGEHCRCGHGAELHDLARDNTSRKGCSVSVGPKALRCPCNHFQTEAEVSE